MSIHRLSLASVLFAVLVCLNGCRGEASSQPPATITSTIAPIRIPFRPVDDGYAVQHTGYRATLSAQGQLRFTASNVPEALTLRTVSVGRVTMSASGSSTPKVKLQDETDLLLPMGEAVERWSASARGVEQSWSFAQRPSGTGDLQVSISVEGMKLTSQSEDGLHFGSVRYGLAMWIDAAGKRTTIVPRFESGSIRIEVPSSVIDASSYPAVLDPLISPEFELDAPVYVVRAEQWAPAIVFDGTNYFVVWRECLTNIQCQIVGTRVAQDGTTLDQPARVLSPPLRILNAADKAAQLGLAFDGTSYLVAWSYDGSIFGMRVLPDGTTATASPFTIAAKHASYIHLAPAVAAGGGKFLVVWEASQTVSSQVHGKLVAADGTVAPSVITVTSASNGSRPSVAYAGTTFVVAWSGNMRRVNSTGTMPALPFKLGTAPTPAVSTDGTDFFLAWPAANPLEVMATRFDQDGVQLTPIPLHIPTTAGASALSRVSVASTTGGYLLAWAETVNGASRISGARLNAAGDVLTRFSFANDPKEQQGPVLMTNPAGALVVWETPNPTRATVPVLAARRLDTSEQTLDAQPLVVSRTANVQGTNAVTFDGTNYLAVWVDSRGASSQLFGARVSPSGVTLDTPALELSKDPAGPVRAPRAASGGGLTLVGWLSQTGMLKVVRVDGSGTILDVTPIDVVPMESEDYEIAWNGQSFTIVWSRTAPSQHLSLRLGVDGVPIDATPAVIMDFTPLNDAGSGIGYSVWHTSLTCTGTGQCLVLWQDNRHQVSTSTGSTSIYGARLEHGTVLDPGGFLVSIDPNQAGDYREGTFPTVAWANGNYVGAWIEWPRGIVGTRISTAGAVLDTDIPLLASGLNAPQLVSAGTNLLLLEPATLSLQNSISISRLIGAQLDTQSGLTVLRTDELQIAQSLNGPSAASNGQRQIFVVTSHASPTQRVSRAFGQFVSYNTGAQGAACSASQECASGFCVDGVCCDTACGNNAATDCLSCSAARGATTDGTCTPLNAGSCFEGGSRCLPGTCSAGICGNTMPVVCLPSTEQCRAASVCDPATGTCSTALAENGVSCNDGNACTTVDTCTNGVCAGQEPVICTAQGQCHVAGVCDPATGTCSNPVASDGTSCNDGNACTTVDSCTSGTCIGEEPVVCAAQDQCHVAGVCDPATGTCSTPVAPDGLSCDDGNLCTTMDSCLGGTCAGTPVQCGALDSCHVAGICDPATGLCSNPQADDGTPCNDGNACTTVDSCTAGTCVGREPVVCAAQDQCHVAGICDPATGTCSTALAENGVSCDDGNACTTVDTCTNGVCTGQEPVICTAQDQCHVAGVCDPVTGTCPNPQANDGTPCNDGNACTTVDTCTGGACVGQAPVVCTAQDECHVAGVCDPATGTCSNPLAPDGLSCDDGNACTTLDSCTSGVCLGAEPVICAAQDQCHVAGICDPATGTCSNPEAEDGTSCNDGNACTTVDACTSGACVGQEPVVCTAQDQCHVAGVCDPTTGTCSTPAAEDGVSCDDGNACTSADSCFNGTCAGTPVQCAALDSCHVAGICNPATGTCSDPLADDGTPCEEGTCQLGACTPSETMDGGMGDGGIDGGDEHDAGSGESDAGPVEQDAGPADAAQVDAGIAARPVAPPSCGCHGGFTVQAWWLGIGALAVIRRRRGSFASR